MEQERSTAASGRGSLVVQVTTANNAIPLEGAAVTVRGEDGSVRYELRSGRDGRTDRIALPAPSREESQRPSAGRPYAVYSIEIALSGYEKAFYTNVPVFDGITAVQQANLIPTPENGFPDGFTLNEGMRFEGGTTGPLGG